MWNVRGGHGPVAAAGFKIVLHWMPNLHGATPESDRADFARLWQGFCPDEIKIYPNQLLAMPSFMNTGSAASFSPIPQKS